MVFTFAISGGSMDPKTLHDRISKADYTIFRDLKAIPDADYSRFADLATSTNPEVRQVLVRFALAFRRDWSREILFTLLRDSEPSVRSMAAAGLKERARPADGKRLLKELEFQIIQKRIAEFAKLELSLAIGNAGDKETLEPLLAIRKLEKEPETGEAMDMALAKLGFVKETRKLDFSLKNGSAEDVDQALTTIQYINDPSWVEKVTPLLLDDRVARVLSLGPATFRVRVCDRAINTLRTLDPEGRVPSDLEPLDTPYSKRGLESVRKAYGLLK